MALDEAAFGPTPEHRPTRRRRFRFLTYPFRFSFRLVKRSIAGVLRTIAYHPVSSLLVLMLCGAVGFLGYRDFAPSGGFRLGAGGSTNQSLPPSPAAEDFIKGQTTFNAALMWQSFSDPLKQQLAQRGTNQQTLQRQLDQRKQSGMKVDQVDYVGGVNTAEGSRLFVYVLTIEAPNNQGVAESHYVLTVDQSDKIIKVE
jgi:hypothetical protein